MKALKIYLMIMGGLLTLALLAGVVVWYLYQDLPGANPKTLLIDTEEGETRSEPVGTSQDEKTLIESETRDKAVSTSTPVYTVTPESLTENQRAVLTTFGMGDSSFTVTTEMIACAKDAVGDVRFEEILGGSAPGPLEAMSLLPCMQ